MTTKDQDLPPETPPTDGPEEEGQTDEQIWEELKAQDASDDASAQGDDQEPPDEPETDPAPSEEADPAPESNPDPLASASPEVRKMVEGMQHDLASARGRISALMKQRSQPRSPGAGDADPDPEAAKRSEELDRAAEEYPDIVQPLVDTVKDLSEKVTAITEADEAARADLLAEENRILSERHPEGLDVVSKNAPAFWAWLDSQPDEVKAVVQANSDTIVDGRGTAEVLTNFKAHLDEQTAPEPEPGDTPPVPDKQTQKRDLRLRGAKGTQSKGPAVSVEPAGDVDDPKAHWDWAGRQMDKRK